MKVVILVSGLPPQCNGGSEIAAQHIAQQARLCGHDIQIVAVDKKSRATRGISYVLKAMKEIRKSQPDLIHAQSAYLAPAALLAKWYTGIPYLLYERGGVDKPSLFNKPLYTITLRYASRIVAQTEYQKTQLRKFTTKEIEVIPNGIDISNFNNISRTEARKVLGLPIEIPIILSVGRCRPEKNLACFVNTAKLIPSCLFLLVGDGPQLAMLKEMAQGYENIKFAGNINNDKIHLYMSAGNILVNSSFSEGFPMAVLEGMASGLPVIAPKICGLPEIITTGENGLLVEVNNHFDTAWAIKKILSNPEWSNLVSQNNLRKARQYTWASVVKKLYG